MTKTALYEFLFVFAGIWANPSTNKKIHSALFVAGTPGSRPQVPGPQVPSHAPKAPGPRPQAPGPRPKAPRSQTQSHRPQVQTQSPQVPDPKPDPKPPPKSQTPSHPPELVGPQLGSIPVVGWNVGPQLESILVVGGNVDPIYFWWGMRRDHISFYKLSSRHIQNIFTNYSNILPN